MLQTSRLYLALWSLNLIKFCLVSGINLDISPSIVVLQSQSPTKTSFECNTISSDVSSIFKISLSKVSEFGNEEEFATAEPGGVKLSTETAPASLKKSSANALGGIDTNTPSQSTLRVEFDTIQMACADAGTYKCAVVFSETPYSRQSTRNLSVYALPSPLDLVATVDGTTRGGTFVSPLEIAINRTISFSCNGKIGSDTANTIRWQITSRMNEGQFNLHNPTPSTINDGTVSATPVDCSYSRTSTMTYVTTVEDSNRMAKLAFKCTTTVNPPGSQQYTTESEVFYIDVLEGSTGASCDDALPSDLDLVATVDGTTRVGTPLSPLQIAINRKISFSCNGTIGSDTSNTIRWKITSRIHEGQFNLHNPTPTTINDGTVSDTPVDCSYSRTSTMTYVTTVEDSNRIVKLAFKCTTTVTPPGLQPYTTESEVFYVRVLQNKSVKGYPSIIPLICSIIAVWLVAN